MFNIIEVQFFLCFWWGLLFVGALGQLPHCPIGKSGPALPRLLKLKRALRLLFLRYMTLFGALFCNNAVD